MIVHASFYDHPAVNYICTSPPLTHVWRPFPPPSYTQFSQTFVVEFDIDGKFKSDSQFSDLHLTSIFTPQTSLAISQNPVRRQLVSNQLRSNNLTATQQQNDNAIRSAASVATNNQIIGRAIERTSTRLSSDKELHRRTSHPAKHTQTDNTAEERRAPVLPHTSQAIRPFPRRNWYPDFPRPPHCPYRRLVSQADRATPPLPLLGGGGRA